LRRSSANRRECLTLWQKRTASEAFQKWRWCDRCLHAGGNYFEGYGDQ
jgi:hypothetical protein